MVGLDSDEGKGLTMTIKTYLALAGRKEPMFKGYQLSAPHAKTILGFRDLPFQLVLSSAKGTAVYVQARTLWDARKEG
jgi:hypothetical protein